jgi:pimeloyl-ACP methyl ester carboxylesterase
MFRDAKGTRRPLARIGREQNGSEHIALWYDDFVRQETVMGDGGQIHSFEAVFSDRGPDGKPVPLFDRATGAVNSATAKTWEKYDIRLILERNWATLGPKLKGKLHIYAGDKDTFYLDGAARLLKTSLEGLGSDAEIVIVPDMGHQIHQPGVQDMDNALAHPKSGGESK